MHKDGLQTTPEYAQPMEISAMSRRRLSFFAQLQRPKQVYKICHSPCLMSYKTFLSSLHIGRVDNTVSGASAH